MPVDDVTITELEEFSPSRVDGVGKGANGFPILMLKGLGKGDVTNDELPSADDRPECTLCEGTGTIREGHVKCPRCLGTGNEPRLGDTTKTLSRKEQNVAPSGVPVPSAKLCPTCDGSGTLANGEKCVDCDGTGNDDHTPPKDALNTVDAFGGSQDNGNGRLKVDKSDLYKDASTPQSCVASEIAALKAGLSAANDGDYQSALAFGNAAVAMSDILKPMVTNDETKLNARNTLDSLLDRINKRWSNEKSVQDLLPDITKAMKEAISVIGSKVNDVVIPGVTKGTLVKRNMDPDVGGGVDRDKIPSEDFAGPDRTFPIVTAADVADAAQSIGRAGSANQIAKVKANIIAIAERKGPHFTSELPESWKDELSTAKGITSGPNPFLGMAASVTNTANNDDGSVPGSPAWEASDAATISAAADSLIEASNLIQYFINRERIEGIAGAPSALFETWDGELALMNICDALDIVARIAFYENLSATTTTAKSLDEELSKSGKRLSAKTITALAAARDHLNALMGDHITAARDHINDVLGDDAPASDEAAKTIKDVLEMTPEELQKLVASTVTEVLKGKGVDTSDAQSIEGAKDANKKSKKKNPKAENTALEDEVKQGDGTTASGTNQATGAAKAELTAEQIEARKARKAAKAQLAKAKKLEKKASKQAKMAKALEDASARDKATLLALSQSVEQRLATIEKMAAPGGPVKTRPASIVAKASEREILEMEIARFDSMARETSDQDLRKGYIERAKIARAKLTEI